MGSQWKEVHVGHTRNDVQRTTTEDGSSSSGCVSQDSTHRYCLGLCLFLLLLQFLAAPTLPSDKLPQVPHSVTKGSSSCPRVTTKISRKHREQCSHKLCCVSSMEVLPNLPVKLFQCSSTDCKNHKISSFVMTKAENNLEALPCIAYGLVLGGTNHAKDRFCTRNVSRCSNLKCSQ